MLMEWGQLPTQYPHSPSLQPFLPLPPDGRHRGGDLRAGRDAGCDGLGLCHFQVQTYIIPGTYIMPVTLFEFSSVTF